MRSIIAALRILVLPFGALSGRRIILNGIRGVIEWFDVNGKLRGRIGDDEFPQFANRISFFTGSAVEEFPGFIQTREIGTAGTTRQLIFDIQAPEGPGVNSPFINFATESEDGAIRADVQAFADEEVWSLPRGLKKRDQRTANSGAVASGSLFDFILTNVRLIAGRAYEFTVDCADGANFSSAAAAGNIDLEAGGVKIGRIWHWPAGAGSGTTKPALGRFLYLPTVSNSGVTFRLRAATSAGTIDMLGSATEPRTFAVKDIGKAEGF